MKISELIQKLESEMEKRGDLPIMFYGSYGSSSEPDDYVIATKDLIGKEYDNYIWVWTGINTG